MLSLKRTAKESCLPIINTTTQFQNYRDAGYGPATYFLSIPQLLEGFEKSIQIGLFHVDQFDLTEYEFYEKIENGDFNWISRKFLALATPKDDPAGNFSIFNSFSSGNSKQSIKSENGSNLFSAYYMTDLIKFLKERNISTIIRLNNDVYDRQVLLDAGIEHIDLFFPDGSTPPDNILKKFLSICETRNGFI